MSEVDIIKATVGKIMEVMVKGRFSIAELQFLQEFFQEGADTTTRVLEKLARGGN